LAGGIFLTDGGMETCLIYHNGIDLPEFSAVHLMTSPAGSASTTADWQKPTVVP
jgi:homocysteine S-methyltransferase